LVFTLVLLIISANLYRVISAWVGLSWIATAVLPPNSFDALGLGALLAVFVQRGSPALSKLIYIVPLASFVWLLWAFHALPQLLVTAEIMKTAVCLVFVGLIFFLYRNAVLGKISYIVSFPALIYIGKISYGMYVMHAYSPGVVDKILSGLGIDMSNYPISLAVLWVMMTVLLASICWYVIETPINHMRKHITARGLESGAVSIHMLRGDAGGNK
jgi:peptidoglycan/LPS O-acetylase OafA/YrhL